jgi:hypothetical protein
MRMARILSMAALLALTGFSVGASQSQEGFSHQATTPQPSALGASFGKAFDAGTGYCGDGNGGCTMGSPV